MKVISFYILCFILGIIIADSFYVNHKREVRIISAIQDSGCNVNKRRGDG